MWPSKQHSPPHNGWLQALQIPSQHLSELAQQASPQTFSARQHPEARQISDGPQQISEHMTPSSQACSGTHLLSTHTNPGSQA
jgi:hypothetical protein